MRMVYTMEAIQSTITQATIFVTVCTAMGAQTVSVF